MPPPGCQSPASRTVRSQLATPDSSAFEEGLFSSLSRALGAAGSAVWAQTCATVASLVVLSQWGVFLFFFSFFSFFLNFSKLNLRNRKERPNQVGRAGSGRHSFSGARSCCLRLPAFCQRQGPPRTFVSFLAVSLATLGRRAVWQELNRNRFSRRCVWPALKAWTLREKRQECFRSPSWVCRIPRS